MSAIVIVGSVKKFCVGKSSFCLCRLIDGIDIESNAFRGREHPLIYVNSCSIHLEIIIDGHRYVIIPKARSTVRAISVP